jgi:hypothetical protein
MAQYKPSEFETEAIELVRREKSAWETATCFVTRRVAFNMRFLIELLQKNFYGVFDQPIDPITNRPKIWVPLTESLVDSAVKNIDLDTKDVNFRANNPESIGLAKIVRSLVKCYLDKLGFGEKLDDFEKRLAIEGTAVWKTIEVRNDGKTELRIVPVPLLNIYIDPTAPSIQEAYRFTERSLISPDEFKNYTGWKHIDDLPGQTNLNRNDPMMAGVNGGYNPTSKYRDTWETWGKIPKRLITKNSEDQGDVDGHIVVSGLEITNGAVCHLIEENPKKIKPYEEAWYSRVPGRWYGRGIAEKVMWLQLWANTIVNIRVNRSYVTQLGIFKIRRGSNITPQMIGRLAANGAIVVNSMDDIDQFNVEDVKPSSYKDEAVIWDWAQKNTSLYDAATGEQLPSSTTATIGAIQSNAAQSQFTLIKEQVGMFLQRWIKRQAMPLILKNMTQGELLELTGDPEDLRAWDEFLVNKQIYTELEKMHSAGQFVNPEEVMMEYVRLMEQLKSNPQRFVKVDTDFDPLEYEVEVYVTNEELDKGVLVQNLMTALQAAPQYAEQIMQEIADLTGIGPFKAAPMPEQGPTQPGQLAPGGSPATPPQRNPQQVFSDGNTMNR